MTEEELKAIEVEATCLEADWTQSVSDERGHLARRVPDLIAEVRRLRGMLEDVATLTKYGPPEGVSVKEHMRRIADRLRQQTPSRAR